MTKLSSIYLSHNFGGWVVELMVLVSISSMKRLATMALKGNPMAAPYIFTLLTLVEEIVIFEAKLQKSCVPTCT